MQEVNGKHLLKAEPLNAILDPQYFVRQVHECVMRVLSERLAREQHQAIHQIPVSGYACVAVTSFPQTQPLFMALRLAWYL